MFTKLFTAVLLLVAGVLHAESTDAMTKSLKASETWLSLVDNGRYAESWDTASKILQSTVPKNEWEAGQRLLRQPLGKPIERNLVGQYPAENPPGLAAGSYMIIRYQTKFASQPQANEIVFLSLGYDGIWRVMNYQVSQGA